MDPNFRSEAGWADPAAGTAGLKETECKELA